MERKIKIKESPPIAAVLLAAGMSTRAGRRNKLLVPAPNNPASGPMVRVCAELLLASATGPVIVVTGYQAPRVEAILAGCDVTLVNNPDFRQGMAGSLAVGISAVPDAAAAAIVALGDMPNLEPATIAALITAFDAVAGRTICVPVQANRRGHPVLFGRAHFAALRQLTGDRGGKAVIGANAAAVVDVAVDDPGIHLDFDNP